LRLPPGWASLAGGDYLILIKPEGVSALRRLMREISSGDEIISRRVLTVIFAAANLIYIKSDGQIFAPY
jgi:hypothetical protein